MMNMEGFVADFDDSFDSTYATWGFEVPEKWKADFDALMNNKPISDEYLEQLKTVFPKLEDKFDEMFRKAEGKEGE